LSTALVVLDDSLLVTYLNTAAETLFGVSWRRTVGRSLADVVHPAQELLALCQRAFSTGLTFSLHEFTARVGDREIVLDCRVTLLDHEHALVLEFLDTERDRRMRREAELVAQQRLSRRIIRQLAH
jgi:two-component system nitrogen regulation sensor histidine kinase GlnL